MRIGQTYNGYFLINPSSNTNDDHVIAKLFEMGLEEYRELLIKYGARAEYSGKEYYFKNKEDIEKFINSDELLPYIIMFELEK